jgi:hypothetical protein
MYYTSMTISVHAQVAVHNLIARERLLFVVGEQSDLRK